MSTLKKIAIAAGVFIVIRTIAAYSAASKKAGTAALEAAAALQKQGIKVGPNFAANYKKHMTWPEHELFMKAIFQSENPTPEQQRIMSKVLAF
jgi:hypothetical protein